MEGVTVALGLMWGGWFMPLAFCRMSMGRISRILSRRTDHFLGLCMSFGLRYLSWADVSS